MSKKTLLEVKNFSISYKQDYYKVRQLKDAFVGLFANPLATIFRTKDRFLVLDNISFKVSEGDIIGIIGVNGVGKTTLCRHLAGIIGASGVMQKARTVSAIFDTNIAIYPDLTGRENALVLAALLYSGLSDEERMKTVEEAIQFSELKDFIDTPINVYSKGMKARLYLSLVTARAADLVILDEVTGGTDVFFSQKFKLRIDNFIKGSGAAVIVSHNTNDIKEYCNRVIILSEKKILYDGNIEEGIQKYLSLSP